MNSLYWPIRAAENRQDRNSEFDPVPLVDEQQVLDQAAFGAEPVPDLLVDVRADLLAEEVDHDRLDRAVVAYQVEPDRAADPLGHVDRLFEQRLDPFAHLAEHVDLGVAPGGLLRVDDRLLARLHLGQVRRLRGEELTHVGHRVSGLTTVGGHRRHGARQQDHLVVAAELTVPVGEPLLVGEDVALVAEDVVELVQLVVEEARRPGDREHPRRLQVVDVADGPGRAAGRASACRTPAWPTRAARRPSGTRSRRRTGAGARARGPARRTGTGRPGGRRSG